MDVDEEADESQEALEHQSDLDQDKKSKGEEGMNDESKQKTEDKKSFGVKGNEDDEDKKKEEKKQESGSGTESQEERSLAENLASEVERLEVLLLARRGGVVAVGECGLDTSNKNSGAISPNLKVN